MATAKKKANKSPAPRFWKFHQNNSGGSFHIDDATGIGPNVWIEAIDRGHAIYRASAIGIYFNGCEEGIDCPCCGDRWSEPWQDEGEESFSINNQYDFYWHNAVCVHRIDGSIERITKAEAI